MVDPHLIRRRCFHPGGPTQGPAQCDLCAEIDLIVRPGRANLDPGRAPDCGSPAATALSGRIGKDLVTSPALLRAVTAAAARGAQRRLLLSVNQEGGRLDALDWAGFEQLPGAMAIGAAGQETLAEAAGTATAAQLRAVGLTWNLAPVCDLAAWPGVSAVGARSFGSAPARVAALSAAYVRGLQAGGVAATAKHFPGLGGAAADPHHLAPVVDRLLPGALEPFRAVVDAGVACVMVASHTVREIDSRPALASPRVLELLRAQLGFQGVVVSENLSIPAVCEPLGGIERAAVAAVAAGVDVLMLDSEISRGQSPQAARAAGVQRRDRVAAALVDAVDSGHLDRRRVAQAYGRVVALHQAFGVDPTDAAPDWVRTNAHAGRAADRIAAASVTAVRGGAALPLTAQGGRFHAVVRVADRGQRKADSARHGPDLLPAALGARCRSAVPVAAGDRIPDGVGAVVVYGYDTRGAAAAEAARWVACGLLVAQVAFGDPDELAGSPADVLLAAYSPHRASVDAVVAVLTGAARPGGTLPMLGAW